MNEITINLTKKQMRQLKPILDKISEVSLDGLPGMALMQFYHQGIGRACFIDNAYGKLIKKAHKKYLKNKPS